ncbi:hypothetical protein [Stenotrophomonas sp. BIGb0135]|uniref:hypothetical protein n=1 Tax=Stenotrophomonas sp. BIGb0135 TaxID=2940620 RepID=UPI0021682275|nr:hypothetical protein [Stenotrophomonas sp. BIGb0135]MCS4235068.1 hypothetical protein [Stenotrophomonas sp. BIGb0135]MCS4235123.1 hypothetical protein [Stenotrophomonas sp. BIGb0135]
MKRDSAPVRVPAIAWAALVILAAAVVPLRVAEIVRHHQALIFQAEKASGAISAPLQRTSQMRIKET